jgi:hypothetical protein
LVKSDLIREGLLYNTLIRGVAFDKSDLIREGLLYNTLIRGVACGKSDLIREGLLYNTLIRGVAFGKSDLIREGLLYNTVNSFLFVVYQFSWVPANHEFKCSTKNDHLISVWR